MQASPQRDSLACGVSTPEGCGGGRGLAKHRDSGPEWGENCVQGGMGRKGGHGLGVLVHRVRRESRFRSGRHTV